MNQKSSEIAVDFEIFRQRLIFFIFFIIVLFSLLLIRIWYLQVLNGERFRTLSESNRIRNVSVKSPRGRILDRYGRVLADSRPSFNLSLVPEDARHLDIILAKLQADLKVDPEEARKKIKVSGPFRPALIKRDISREEVAFLEEHKLDFPGLSLGIQPVRYYPSGEVAAHLLGYTGEISEKQLKELRGSGYQMGDLTGQYGLEKAYESILKGKNGVNNVEVDAFGRELRILERVLPSPGPDLILNVDLRMQRLAEELMEDHSGAIVVMNPQNGEILALVSKPSFDPNLFTGAISTQNWVSLINNKRHPLQNRAIQGQYPPGSVYKIIVATAALEEEVITPNTVIHCPGHFTFGNRTFSDWKKGGHGPVNLHQALVQSCDVFFYTVGNKLGIDTIARYSGGYGLGKGTGINLGVGEKQGIVPSSKWKMKVLKQPWFGGETISAAIGQGYNLVTPLQMANVISAVANGGTLYQPMLEKRVKSIDGNLLSLSNPQKIGEIPARPSTLKIIREALRGVVNEARGTGFKAKIENIVVAGKTGTVQVVEHRGSTKGLTEELRDHSWFVAFAPFEEPQLAVVVFVENTGVGGSQFAPIAKKLIEDFYRLDLQKSGYQTAQQAKKSGD